MAPRSPVVQWSIYQSSGQRTPVQFHLPPLLHLLYMPHLLASLTCPPPRLPSDLRATTAFSALGPPTTKHRKTKRTYTGSLSGIMRCWELIRLFAESMFDWDVLGEEGHAWEYSLQNSRPTPFKMTLDTNINIKHQTPRARRRRPPNPCKTRKHDSFLGWSHYNITA